MSEQATQLISWHIPVSLVERAREFMAGLPAEEVVTGRMYGATPGTKAGERCEVVLEILEEAASPRTAAQVTMDIEGREDEYGEMMRWHKVKPASREVFVRRALAALVAAGKVRQNGRLYSFK